MNPKLIACPKCKIPLTSTTCSQCKYDFHTLNASVMYNIDPKDVTVKQRNKAKTEMYGIMYSQYGKITLTNS